MKNVMFYLKFSSASRLYLQWLRETIYRLSDVKGRIKSSSRSHELAFAKNGTRMLFKRMFYARDIPYLKRKFVKALNIFTIDDIHNNAQVEKLADSQA